MFPEVSLSLDGLVEEGEDDDQQETVKDTEYGQTTGIRVRARTCSNIYLHSQNIEEINISYSFLTFTFYIYTEYIIMYSQSCPCRLFKKFNNEPQ